MADRCSDPHHHPNPAVLELGVGPMTKFEKSLRSASVPPLGSKPREYKEKDFTTQSGAELLCQRI